MFLCKFILCELASPGACQQLINYLVLPGLVCQTKVLAKLRVLDNVEPKIVFVVVLSRHNS